MLIRNYDWQRVTDPFSLSESDYLLVGEDQKEYWVAYPDAEIPSQVLRQRLAVLAGRHTWEWDWRKHTRVEEMLQSIHDLSLFTQELSRFANSPDQKL